MINGFRGVKIEKFEIKKIAGENLPLNPKQLQPFL
jgi:hypothetical protein